MLEQMHRYVHVLRRVALVLPLVFCPASFAQGVASGICKPASQRTQEIGCWIVADGPVGQLPRSLIFWHLDAYPTLTAAEADKGPRGTVFESLGKIWLMTIEDEQWRPAHGTRVSEIGPLEIVAGKRYSAQFLEAIFTPGMTSLTHVHGGPEAWYTVAGETCLETSDGRMQTGRAGGPAVIVPAGLAMHLTATGAVQRRAVVLILYQSDKPPTTQVGDWTPKGLCKK